MQPDIFLFSVQSFGAGEIKSGALKVGAAKVCINPPDNMFPAKGEYQDFIGIHDSLFVRAIVMDNGAVKSALISMDMSGVPEGEFSGSVAAALGIQPEHFFVCATHTHNGMRLARNDNASEYYNLIKNATIKALKDASSKLQPARVGYATGKAYVNTNRDQKLGEGYHMGYVPDGPTDKTVAVLSFTSLTGEPIAIYANYPVHAVVMYRAKTKDGHPEVSADLPGATARYVEAHFNNAVALWTAVPPVIRIPFSWRIITRTGLMSLMRAQPGMLFWMYRPAGLGRDRPRNEINQEYKLIGADMGEKEYCQLSRKKEKVSS